MPFDPVDPRQSFPDLERGILQYWKEEDVFKRSVSHRKESERFTFYDGPPFATGLPHYGHLLTGTIKDVIPRYQTMRGKRVERRFGWDCHGLPVEYEIEKEHGIGSKKDIEEMGVAAFNKLCRNAVLRYAREWRKTVERMGRWVDMDHDYRTMDPDYMESIWWVMKELHEKKLLTEGYKPMHLCPRCVTPLSNFEVTQGYKDVTDQSVVVRFALTDEPDTFLLAWTTTPWTLPGNLFLAIGPKIPYVKITHEGAHYIVAEALAAGLFGEEEAKVGKQVSASSLLGKSYRPLFPFFADRYEGKAFRIVEGDFVTTEDGTGIVHIAPGFGEDDFRIGEREGVELLQHVTPEGRFVKEVTEFSGEEVKPADDPTKTDRKIVAHLKAQGSVFKAEHYKHSYPHCWRCDSPLINYAASSWFVAVEALKKKMIAANKKTTWVPAHIRDGRFGKWLEGARDWAISRNRYWGTPLPIWKNDAAGAIKVLGSREDLMKKAPARFTKISVVRHAESQGNVDCIYQGLEPGTDLTARGKKQAQARGENLAGDGIPVTAIYASPLARTRQTAGAIGEAVNAEPVIDARIREVAFGEYEGKHVNFDDLTFVRERRAHKIEKNSVESIYHFDGMETWTDIEKRCRDFLGDVLKKHRGEHVVIVTHADILMNFVQIFTGEDKVKVSHQPYPDLADRRTFYWDHDEDDCMDLHKEHVDGIVFPDVSADVSVDAVLVRHGETDWNKRGLCQGQEADEPLNDRGRAQAQETAKTLKGQTFDCIVTSDLKRAKETAEILSQELGVPVEEQTELLRERAMGEWVGKSLAEISADHPPVVPGGEFALHAETPADGESLSAFLRRGQEAYEHLLKKYAGRKILVVAHGGFIRAITLFAEGLTYREAAAVAPENAKTYPLPLRPLFRRIPDVLDCWFESGSMPYAQQHWPFESGDTKDRKLPTGFPADFIAEGLDQTRGWFYTLTVLGTALYGMAPFQNVIVNGIVLAEDGKKMSKRLKNYPEPTEIVEKYGADAIRFALMHSPAVRGEDLRFSEKVVEEKLRSVLLPLWNAFSFLVTYANAANWNPPRDFSLAKAAKSTQPLDRWIVAKTQQLINDMTEELERYDLSATCDHLAESIDGLTNWYIRLSRRRFAGKGEKGQTEAFDTLYRVLLTQCQLLAPFCPYLTEAIYLHLVEGDHHSIHLTDWPQAKKLTKTQEEELRRMEDTRMIVSLGLSLRAGKKIKVRQPLTRVTFALPPGSSRVHEDVIREELNVKEVTIARKAEELGRCVAEVDARKVGPRLGGKVQEVIRAAKEGNFTQKGSAIVVLGETLTADEARVVYEGNDEEEVACAHGIVVKLETKLTEELEREGRARELIRTVQRLRKDAGLTFTDTIALSVEGADDVLKSHASLIEKETRGSLAQNDGEPHAVVMNDRTMTIRFEKTA